MRLTNSAFADQGLTGSILGRRIGQMDFGREQIYWYRCNLGQKSFYWCYTAIPEEGGGLGDWRWDGWNISFHLRKPGIWWKPCHLKTLNTMGTWTAFWPLSYLPFCFEYKIWTNKCFLSQWCQNSQNWKFWNFTDKYHTKDICETFLNCLKFKLFYRERENLWIIYWVIFTCTVREETGESFGPKKLNIQKGEMLINIVDISSKTSTFGYPKHLNRNTNFIWVRRWRGYILTNKR